MAHDPRASEVAALSKRLRERMELDEFEIWLQQDLDEIRNSCKQLWNSELCRSENLFKSFELKRRFLQNTTKELKHRYKTLREVLEGLKEQGTVRQKKPRSEPVAGTPDIKKLCQDVQFMMKGCYDLLSSMKDMRSKRHDLQSELEDNKKKMNAKLAGSYLKDSSETYARLDELIENYVYECQDMEGDPIVRFYRKEVDSKLLVEEAQIKGSELRDEVKKLQGSLNYTWVDLENVANNCELEMKDFKESLVAWDSLLSDIERKGGSCKWAQEKKATVTEELQKWERSIREVEHLALCNEKTLLQNELKCLQSEVARLQQELEQS